MRCSWPLRFLFIIPLLACFGAVFLWHTPAQSQESQRLSFIRDAEIERTLRDYARPILQAADIPERSVQFVIVRDDAVNAFVAGGMNVFFYTGLLLGTDGPGEVIGVLAHEIGHIAGGHLIRGQEALRQASAEAILATILGVAAGLASGDTRAGSAVLSGGQEIARRNFLAFSRVQESSADAAALSFLDQQKLSAAGLLEFMDKLSAQELLPPERQVEFVRTHPLTRDRIDALQAHVAQSPYSKNPWSPQQIEQHRRMIAKLQGYLDPLRALQTYSADDSSIAAQYARAIAFYRRDDTSKALEIVAKLQAAEPNNPFFYELQAQIYFENGRVAEALPLYRKAVGLYGDSSLLRASFGHALIESRNDKNLPEAEQQLLESLRLEAHQPFVWRLLATLWGRQGLDGQSAYALAEEAMARGDNAGAATLAERAEKLLPKDSPFLLKVADIKASSKKPDEN